MSRIKSEDIDFEAHNACVEGDVSEYTYKDFLENDVPAAIAINAYLPSNFDTVKCFPKPSFGTVRLSGSFLDRELKEVQISISVNRFKATLEMRPLDMASFMDLFVRDHPKRHK